MSTSSRRVAAPGRKLPPPGPDLHAVRRPAEVEGLWRPTPECSRALGAPAGKVRLVSCSLCAACRASPDATERAEGRMLAKAAAALARPESRARLRIHGHRGHRGRRVCRRLASLAGLRPVRDAVRNWLAATPEAIAEALDLADRHLARPHPAARPEQRDNIRSEPTPGRGGFDEFGDGRRGDDGPV